MSRGWRTRLIAPEVVQTSAMDCGPAALKCLLNGFGVAASYGRLREACQTEVDGTSIDTLEGLANTLGLDAEQIMVPVDHLLIRTAEVLPAIVVIRQPNGLTHFVVAWRRHGPVVQVMDPATGRRWPRCERFLDEVYVHSVRVEAAMWREWAGSRLFLDGLTSRATAHGVPGDLVRRLTKIGLDDHGWRSLGALDASLRMVAALERSGAFRGSTERALTLERLFHGARTTDAQAAVVPESYWSVRPASSAGSEGQVLVRGAVLVRVRGVRSESQPSGTRETLSPELAAVLHEPAPRPARYLLQLLGADGVLAPTALVIGLVGAAAGVVLEALLLANLIDVGQRLEITGQRLATVAALLLLLAVLLALELPIAAGVLRLGRGLDARLRIAFLEKIPRLGDRYFSSRPSSDMAERSHNTHCVRLLPQLGSHLVRACFELLLTALAIAWFYPGGAVAAALAAAAALVVPLFAHPVVAERDLRLRTHTGALGGSYLDAFLGLVPVRAHAAEAAVRSEHEALLVEWARSGYALIRTTISVETVQLTIGFAMASWLILEHVWRGGEGGGALLVAYWALNIPVLGQEIAQIAWQYPTHRNITLRLLEPLGALEESTDGASRETERARIAASRERGVQIQFREVSVKAGGHTILDNVDLTISAGTHVAIVGASGAGKSSLLGALLGWHKPSTGTVRVDDLVLDGARLDALRGETAWVDPGVTLWNRTLHQNLEYGLAADSMTTIADTVAEADLQSVIETLPLGLQTPLGEGGTLVSGGEGQRARFGRALGRDRARLVILDEPFRGLQRDLAGDLVGRARRRWCAATLLCVTHHISETMAFDRVLVIERGHVVEDGRPGDLAARPESRYRALLDAERELQRRLSAESWRVLRLEKQRIVDTQPERAPA